MIGLGPTTCPPTSKSTQSWWRSSCRAGQAVPRFPASRCRRRSAYRIHPPPPLLFVLGCPAVSRRLPSYMASLAVLLRRPTCSGHPSPPPRQPVSSPSCRLQAAPKLHGRPSHPTPAAYLSPISRADLLLLVVLGNHAVFDFLSASLNQRQCARLPLALHQPVQPVLQQPALLLFFTAFFYVSEYLTMN